jgi:phage-related tail protein
MKITRQALAAAAAIGLAAAGGSAFTAGNSVPTSTRVGQAAQVTSGYAVSNVTYTLDANLGDGTGDDVVEVSMTVAPDNGGTVNAKQVRVRVVSGSTYYTCTNATPATSTAWTCALPNLPASTLNTLDVVATN